MELSELSTLLILGAAAAYVVAMIAFAVDVAGLSSGRPAQARRRAAGIGVSTTWLGFALHVVGVITRGIAAGRVPWANMYEFTLMFTFFLVGIFLVVNLKRDIRFVGLPVTFLAVVGLVLAVSVLFVAADGVQPALNSYWLVIHVSVATLATALLGMAAIFSVLQLIAHHIEGADPAAPVRGRVSGAASGRSRARVSASAAGGRGGAARSTAAAGAGGGAARAEAAPASGGTATLTRGNTAAGARRSAGKPAEAGTAAGRGTGTAASGGRLARMMASLPSAATLEQWAYRTTAIGFVAWTFTVVAGAIWAEHAWGRPWGWDPKETWSFVIWVIYAAYLHARATVGWTAEKFAYFCLVGFAALLFNFYGVNLFIDGKHSYSGL